MRTTLSPRAISRHINDYESAKSFLDDRQRVKVANNTYAEKWEGSIGIRLHKTVIVRYYEDGRVELQSGGWYTRTTGQRINALLPDGYRLEQRDFEWFIVSDHPITGVSTRTPFSEGIRLAPGKLPYASRSPDA